MRRRCRQKAKFILATDGKNFEAENLVDGETIACNYPDFHDHFWFFLALAGITTVKQIRENAFDIKATGRLNRLYLELSVMCVISVSRRLGCCFCRWNEIAGLPVGMRCGWIG